MANTYEFVDGNKVYFNQFDLSCAFTSFDVSIGRLLVDTRTICQADWTPTTQYTPAVSFNGFATYGADLWDEESFDLMTSTADSVFTYVHGTARGDRSYDVIGKCNARSQPVNVAQLIGLNGALTGKQWIRGAALAVDEVITATGALTGVNIGAIAANSTTGIVWRLTAKNTLTTITTVVQHSSDSTNGIDGTWATVTGLSLTATGITYEIDTITTGTSAWLRLNTTALTGTSATLTVTAGPVN